MKLTDICDVQGGSQPPKEEWSFEEQEGYIRMLQIRDFTQSERVTPEYIKISNSTKICEADDILIARYGASIGKILTGLAGAYNVAIMRTIPDTSKIKKKYLYYYLKSPYFQNAILNVGSRAAQAGFNKEDLSKLDIECPELSEQENIASILDKVEIVIRKRKEELVFLDKLIKARFVEMFGDMYLNSKGWPEAKLENMADVVSGITKGRKTKAEDLTEVPYMAVSNVKDGYIDWTTMKTIEATQQEIEKYRLLADDVLMTEGGDPDKVGRGAIIKEPLENCIHQNHIFRVRLDESMMRPEFFAEYLQHQRSKRYFLRCAKQTTGIASINMTQLRALPVLMPPLSRQEEFVLFKAQVNKSKVAVQRALDETQLLFDSLMQKYFG